MPRTPVIRALMVAGALSLFGSAMAANYYAVTPLNRAAKTTPQVPTTPTDPGEAAPAVQVRLGTFALPAGEAGKAYAGFDFKPLLSVTGDPDFNAGAVTWSLAAGTLPAGMTLSGDGRLAGTPTAATPPGGQPLTVRATYKTAQGVQTYNLQVALVVKLTLSPGTLPEAEYGKAYAGFDFKTLLRVEGDPQYDGGATFSTTSTLPTGLTLSAAGLLAGTPSKVAEEGQELTVRAAYKGKTSEVAYTIIVNGQALEVLQVTAGATHSCARLPDNTVKCWGVGTAGQLGNGASANSKVPVQVSGLTGVVRVEAGTSHTCAITSAGAGWCWGSGSNGQLGNPANSSNVPVQVAGLANAVDLSAGSNYNCAITNSAQLYCWGYNANGMLGDNTTTTRRTATLVNLPNVSKVSAGNSATCAVSQGTLFCWGHNSYGKLGLGDTTRRLTPVSTGLTSVVDVSTSSVYHTCAVRSTGAVHCWGDNQYGQLGHGVTDTAPRYDASWVTPGISAIRVSVGSGFTCAITTSKQAMCWGRGNQGQLGIGSLPSVVNYPVLVQGLTGVEDIDTGDTHACVATYNGRAKCWGANNGGQIGTGPDGAAQQLSAGNVLTN